MYLKFHYLFFCFSESLCHFTEQQIQTQCWNIRSELRRDRAVVCRSYMWLMFKRFMQENGVNFVFYLFTCVESNASPITVSHIFRYLISSHNDDAEHKFAAYIRVNISHAWFLFFVSCVCAFTVRLCVSLCVFDISWIRVRAAEIKVQRPSQKICQMGELSSGSETLLMLSEK